MEKDNKISKINNDFYSTVDEPVFTNIKYFSSNESYLNIFKKSEKISSALLLIAGIIKDNQSYADKLKKISLDLVEHALALVARSSVQRLDLVTTLIGDFTHIHTLLTLGSNSRAVSPMNATLIKKEIEYCISLLSEQMPQSHIMDDAVISRSFFHIHKNYKTDTSPERTNIYKGHEEKTKLSNKIIQNQVSIKDRKNIIIEHLKVKDNQNVKDFVDIIEGCSEKTIQRELIDLMHAGLIVRKGERRWSTYSLASRV